MAVIPIGNSLGGNSKIYPGLLAEIALEITDLRQLYRSWSTVDRECKILQDADLKLGIAGRRKLAIRWLEWQIFTEWGPLSARMENQVLTYFTSTPERELMDWLGKYWKYDAPQRKKLFREYGIQSGTEPIRQSWELFSLQGLPATLPKAFPKLIAQIESEGTACLDLILDHVVENVESLEQQRLAIVVGGHHLHRQLAIQGFTLPEGVLGHLPWSISAGKPRIRTIIFDLELRGSETVWRKQLTVKLPTCFSVSENFLSGIRKLLLCQWVLQRLFWSLLNVRIPKLAGALFVEIAHSSALIDVLEKCTLGEILSKLSGSPDSSSELLGDIVLAEMKDRLYRRANTEQIKIIEQIRARSPKVFIRALAFGPESPACGMLLAKQFELGTPYYQTLKQLVR